MLFVQLILRRMKRFSVAVSTYTLLLCTLLLASSAKAVLIDDPATLASMRATPADALIVTAGRQGQEEFSRVNTLLEEGKLDALISQARRYLEQNPDSGLAYEVLGVAYLQSGSVQEAVNALIAATQVETGQAGPWTKLGILLMANGKVDDAEKALHKALQFDPDNRVAHQRLGLIYEYRKDDQKAIHHFYKGLQGVDKNYLGIAVNLGRLLNQHGRPQATIDVLEPRVREDEKVGEAHLVLASAYLATEQFEKAAAHFARASELMSDSREVKLGLVMATRGAGKFKQAHQLVNQLLKEEPEWRLAYLEQAEIFLSENNIAEANAALSRAQVFGLRQSYVDERLAKYYMDIKDFDQSGKLYQKAISAGTAKPVSYMRLAEIMQYQEGVAAGIEVLRHGVEQYPEDSNLRFRLGSALALNRFYSEAVAEFSAGYQLSPKDPRILRAYTLALLKASKLDLAVKIAAELSQLIPGGVGEKMLYASALEAGGRKSETEQIYRQVLQQDPENVAALNNLAFLLAGRDELADAEQLSRKANQLVKNNVNLMDTLGWVLYRQGRYQEALDIYDRVLMLDRAHAVAHYHQGLALIGVGNDKGAKKALSTAVKLNPDAEWAGDAEKMIRDLPG